jgi:hypothetical protein
VLSIFPARSAKYNGTVRDTTTMMKAAAAAIVKKFELDFGFTLAD